MKETKPHNPIKQLREVAGLTQIEAAERSGINQGNWSAIERRESLEATEVGVLRRIAAALGVGVEKLLE